MSEQQAIAQQLNMITRSCTANYLHGQALSCVHSTIMMTSHCHKHLLIRSQSASLLTILVDTIS